ncbi:MAG: GTPase Era [Bacilli bacterium]
MKSGFISIIGRPNVGKSTILNAIIGKKLAICTSTSNTTRNNILGVYNAKDTQMVFFDTPGIHKPKQHLGKVLNNLAYNSAHDSDVIMFIIDASEKLGKGDMFVLERIKDMKKPVILVINKIDKMKKGQIIEKIIEYNDLYEFSEIVPVSALKKNNIDRLLTVLRNYLPDDVEYYDKEFISDITREFMIAEIIREKVINNTKEEVPHSVTCVIEKVIDDKDKLIISALIVVDRDALKKIIVGKSGSMIKKIGTSARYAIQKEYNKTIHLDLFVKTVKNWREKDKLLIELGIINTDE